MKQIPLLQGKALLIELPEGAYGLRVFKDEQPYISYWIKTYVGRVNLPSGNWRIIGMLSEVTESDASGLVEEQPQENYSSLPEHKRRWWKDYTGGFPFPESRALESLESAIKAEGYAWNNPYGTNTLYYTDKFTGEKKVRVDWAELQSRVLCRERCLLLGREA